MNKFILPLFSLMLLASCTPDYCDCIKEGIEEGDVSKECKEAYDDLTPQEHAEKMKDCL